MTNSAVLLNGGSPFFFFFFENGGSPFWIRILYVFLGPILYKIFNMDPPKETNRCNDATYLINQL